MKSTTLLYGLLIFLVSGLSYGNYQPLPQNYEKFKACDKQGELWTRVVETTYNELPDFSNVGLIQFVAMTFQELSTKINLKSDISPKGWKKYLHRKGAVAKVKIVPSHQNEFTGIFEGAECAILRLSLTYNPREGKKPVAPGLALKVLRDGVPSANISALYALDGQGDNYNFFKNSLSNIVPMGNGVGEKMIHRLFSRVAKYPEQLKIVDMASFDEKGNKEKIISSPAQIFFVPTGDFKISSEQHDVRKDFVSIKEGTVIYKIYGLKAVPANFDYEKDYTQETASKFLKESIHIGDIITTSKFITSKFGDEGIFFRHEIDPKK